jgi:hypothetical protein
VVDYVGVWTKPGNGKKVPAPVQPEMAADASKPGSKPVAKG